MSYGYVSRALMPLLLFSLKFGSHDGMAFHRNRSIGFFTAQCREKGLTQIFAKIFFFSLRTRSIRERRRTWNSFFNSFFFSLKCVRIHAHTPIKLTTINAYFSLPTNELLLFNVYVVYCLVEAHNDCWISGDRLPIYLFIYLCGSDGEPLVHSHDILTTDSQARIRFLAQTTTFAHSLFFPSKLYITISA